VAGLLEQAAAAGQLARRDEVMPDAAFVRLLDAFAERSHPAIGRLREMMAERGWTGWTWFERAGSAVEQSGHPGQLEDRADRDAGARDRERDLGDRGR